MQLHQFHGTQDFGCVQRGFFGEPIVLVVEESPEAARSLTSVLKKAFPSGHILTHTSARASLDVLSIQPVDIAVVDLDLRESTGMEVVRQCFSLSPLTRCVITTIHDDDQHLIPALAAGALGCLLKNQPETVLIQQLRLLADGIPPLAPSIARRILRQFTRTAPDAAADAGLGRLSGREQEVLTLIAKGMAISEVAQLLEISSNTVCSHIKTIYRKRNVSSRAEAALEAKRMGLV